MSEDSLFRQDMKSMLGPLDDFTRICLLLAIFRVKGWSRNDAIIEVSNLEHDAKDLLESRLAAAQGPR